MIEASGIDHIVLHVSDVHRSKEFYTGLLGMTPYRENDRQVFLHAGSQGVALFKKTDGSPVPGGGDMNHLALNVAGGTYESAWRQRLRPARRRSLHLFPGPGRPPPAADVPQIRARRMG